jgi:hypothetical protein
MGKRTGADKALKVSAWTLSNLAGWMHYEAESFPAVIAQLREVRRLNLSVEDAVEQASEALREHGVLGDYLKWAESHRGRGAGWPVPSRLAAVAGT